MKKLTHRPFAALKGRLVAQIIRLPVPDRNDPDRYPGCDEDGPPVDGAAAVLIAFPFGRRAGRKDGIKRLIRSTSQQIAEVRKSEERRGVRR